MLFWPSVLLGVGLGLVNTLAALAVVRLAHGQSQQAFVGLVLGGMALRVAAVAIAVLLIALTLQVHTLGFVLSLFCTFVLGVVVEGVLVLRRPRVSTL